MVEFDVGDFVFVGGEGDGVGEEFDLVLGVPIHMCDASGFPGFEAFEPKCFGRNRREREGVDRALQGGDGNGRGVGVRINAESI